MVPKNFRSPNRSGDMLFCGGVVIVVGGYRYRHKSTEVCNYYSSALFKLYNFNRGLKRVA